MSNFFYNNAQHLVFNNEKLGHDAMSSSPLGPLSDVNFVRNITPDNNTDSIKERANILADDAKLNSVSSLFIKYFKDEYRKQFIDASGDIRMFLGINENRFNNLEHLIQKAIFNDSTIRLTSETSSFICFIEEDSSGNKCVIIANLNTNKVVFALQCKPDLVEAIQSSTKIDSSNLMAAQGSINEILTVGASAAYFSLVGAITNLTVNSINRYTSFSSLLKTTSRNYGSDKSGNTKVQSSQMCILHDLECSYIPDTWFFMYLGYPITVDLKNCCRQHDIDLWCGSKNLAQAWLDYTYINAKLSACIVGTFIDTAYHRLGPILFTLGGAASATAYGLVACWLFFLGTELGGVAIFGTEYFPHDGRHDNSCLCGGNEPTSWCADTCRDMCAEMGKSANCYHCGWKCQYNEKHQLTGVTPDTKSDLPCCPGTDVTETHQNCHLDSNSVAAKKCPTDAPCDECFWFCESDNDLHNPQLYWRLYGANRFPNYLPCCNILPPNPKEFPCPREGKIIH